MTAGELPSDVPNLESEEEQRLELALRAAWAPSELDPKLNEFLIEQALEDPLAPAGEEEALSSARLGRALEGKDVHELSGLADALRHAVRPTAEIESAPRSKAKRGNVVFVTFGGAAALLAAAAAVVLSVSPLRREMTASAPASAPALEQASTLAQSRSTSSLFSERLDPSRATERLDVIASARQRELRANSYARWGVR
jgi:hypothetical protein